MDLSRFKWPIIIVVVGLLIWLTTDGGVSYMHKKLNNAQVGVDAKRDEMNEAAYSRLGGFLMATYRFKKAHEVFNDCLDRYPDGKNSQYILFRIAKCEQKMGNVERAVRILENLRDTNAFEVDSRVSPPDVLELRITKLKELHEIDR